MYQHPRFLSRRLIVAAVAAAAVILGVAAIAMASKPVKGATYSGQIKEHPTPQITNKFPISFKVSGNGKKVTDFSLPSGYPLYCQGGGFGTANSKSAKVSSEGTFKVKLPIIFAPTGDHQGYLKVTGKFGKHRKEKGKVTTHFTKSTMCRGTSKYKTEAG